MLSYKLTLAPSAINPSVSSPAYLLFTLSYAVVTIPVMFRPVEFFIASVLTFNLFEELFCLTILPLFEVCTSCLSIDVESEAISLCCMFSWIVVSVIDGDFKSISATLVISVFSLISVVLFVAVRLVVWTSLALTVAHIIKIKSIIHNEIIRFFIIYSPYCILFFFMCIDN